MECADVSGTPVCRNYGTPEFSDWLNMKVSIPEISLHFSFITRGDMSSAPSDFLESKPERSLQTPGEVTSNVGMSG